MRELICRPCRIAPVAMVDLMCLRTHRWHSHCTCGHLGSSSDYLVGRATRCLVIRSCQERFHSQSTAQALEGAALRPRLHHRGRGCWHTNDAPCRSLSSVHTTGAQIQPDTQHSFTLSSDSTDFWKAIKVPAVVVAVSVSPAPTAAVSAAEVSSRSSAAHSHPELAPTRNLHSCARTSMRQTSSGTA